MRGLAQVLTASTPAKPTYADHNRAEDRLWPGADDFGRQGLAPAKNQIRQEQHTGGPDDHQGDEGLSLIHI